MKLLSITLALLLGVAIAACGGDDSSSGETAATPAPTETPTPVAAGNVDQIAAGITKNTKKEPKVVTPQGDPPAQLVIKDVVKGKGPKAKAGDTLSMQYTGYSWSNGQKFDASWDRGGQPFPFKLGAGMVIPGWDKGMVGMQEGGRRLLIIPPDLGYGPAGSGPIAPNETLVFVVDLKKLS